VLGSGRHVDPWSAALGLTDVLGDERCEPLSQDCKRVVVELGEQGSRDRVIVGLFTRGFWVSDEAAAAETRA
jgi:hypothetical protein